MLLVVGREERRSEPGWFGYDGIRVRQNRCRSCCDGYTPARLLSFLLTHTPTTPPVRPPLSINLLPDWPETAVVCIHDAGSDGGNTFRLRVGVGGRGGSFCRMPVQRFFHVRLECLGGGFDGGVSYGGEGVGDGPGLGGGQAWVHSGAVRERLFGGERARAAHGHERVYVGGRGGVVASSSRDARGVLG